MAHLLVRIFAKTKSVLKKNTGLQIKTWHLEAVFVGLVLSSVALISKKGIIEWIGVLAVFFTWMHASVADRLQEAQAQKALSNTGAEVSCYPWTVRYFYFKEALWLIYFFLLGAWSALAGAILFLLYGWWRTAWRKHHPRNK